MPWSKDPKEDEDKPKRTKEELFKSIHEIAKKAGLKAGAHGYPGTGKTWFCCTAPPPVYILETEQGAAQLANNFPGKDIKVLNCYVSTGDPQQDCLESLELLKEAIDSLSDLEEGTLCIDSGTDLWEWVQGVLRLNVLKVDLAAKVQPSDYKWANAEYRSVMMKCRAIPAHFIFTAREGDVFRDARLTPTGVHKATWQKWTPHWIDIDLYMFKEDVKGVETFRTEIKKFRHHRLDQKLHVDLDFDKLYKIVSPYMVVKK